MLYGNRAKRENNFRRNEILFYVKKQRKSGKSRKVTYLTSETSLVIEFELIFDMIIFRAERKRSKWLFVDTVKNVKFF